MKYIGKNWRKRLLVTTFLLIGLPLGLVFSPTLLYGKTTYTKKYTIHHNKMLNKHFKKRLDNATKIVKKSEIYDPNLKLNICLNDGEAVYPLILEKFQGKAFGYGFFDKVVLNGEANYEENYTEIHGYKWNLEQLIAHEAIHCYQNNKFGFLNSNPVANHPMWKWEGYAEYASRKNNEQSDLRNNIRNFLEFKKKHKDEWGYIFSDGTVAPVDYYEAWIMVQYCLEIKKMKYEELIEDTTSKEMIYNEILSWYYL